MNVSYDFMLTFIPFTATHLLFNLVIFILFLKLRSAGSVMVTAYQCWNGHHVMPKCSHFIIRYYMNVVQDCVSYILRSKQLEVQQQRGWS